MGDYESSERERLRTEAYFSTPAGKRKKESLYEKSHRYLEWRIRNQGLVLVTETMAEHKKWQDKHLGICTKIHQDWVASRKKIHK